MRVNPVRETTKRETNTHTRIEKQSKTHPTINLSIAQNKKKKK
jgi:hypothetical protein